MIVSHLIEVCLICTFWFLMKRENVRRDKLQAEQGGERDLAATAYMDLTDRENMNFRYSKCDDSVLARWLASR